jgi:hypothetical protein
MATATATPHHGPAHRQRVFRHGLARAGAIAGVLVGLSLLVGVLGYHHFAGLYALYAGLVLIASTAVVLSPFMTHVLHAFHAEHDAKDGK